MKRLLLLLILSSVIFSCETELTDFRLENLSDNIVVYGELSNWQESLQVRINKTTAYSPYDTRQYIGVPIKKAKVTIVDTKGSLVTLQEVTDGYYVGPATFVGVEGETYTLKIKTTDGIEIESRPETIKAAPKLATFSSSFINAEKVEDIRININASIADPAQTTDYYFIRRQDYIQFLTTCPPPPPPPASSPPCNSKCWQAPLNTQPILLKDFLVNGKNIPLTINPILVEDFTDWVVQLDVFSVSKTIFDFWQKQEDQRVIGGGLFDKVPVQIIGNLRSPNKPDQQILGVFVVGGVTKKRLVINRGGDDDVLLARIQAYADSKNVRFKEYPLYDCDKAGWVRYNIGRYLPPL